MGSRGVVGAGPAGCWHLAAQPPDPTRRLHSKLAHLGGDSQPEATLRGADGNEIRKSGGRGAVWADEAGRSESLSRRHDSAAGCVKGDSLGQ